MPPKDQDRLPETHSAEQDFLLLADNAPSD